MGKNQHVTPHSGGGFQVKGAGNSRATKVFDTQREAISFARDIAKNQQSELFIHNRTGQIRERNSYGNDPYPPRG
ncbi:MULTISPECIES: DUF2188 domain-containing protein [Bacillales]|uniref:DUF2188 domain-containing protein n=2 Tax=Bacillaceae TaxID=186817 RepID=A0A0V8JQ94_9BACI|nr:MULTISPECIES: DUF2188 domain-containing protein [Bacillales]KSU89236.1 hypothetical protein AS180_03660 [Priestia veravalensis]NMO75633.1 DUF2188 domain-containing protein [Niallia alba]SCB92372.1 hypothetical protein GA0061087_100457 [Priestia flexa]